MKKLLLSLLAIFGVSRAAATKSAAPQMIDPRALHYTMPTVAADELQFGVPTADSFAGAPQFHEDEWRQIEFFPRSRLPEIQKRLTEYKAFERAHRSNAGWSQIYSRRIAPQLVVSSPTAVEDAAAVIGGKPGNSPILHIASRPLGQVQSGFSIEISPDVFLYGLKEDQGITALGAIAFSGADDKALTNAFMALSPADHLMLVDWRAQQVLVSATPGGKVEVWRP